MGSPVAPRPDGLPEGFQLDPELPEGFQLDEPAAAPAAPAEGAPVYGIGGPLSNLMSPKYVPSALRGAARAAIGLVNPMEWARTARAMGELGASFNPATNLRAAVSGEEPPVANAVREISTGLMRTGRRAVGMEGPEAMGEVHGEGLVGVLAPEAIGGIVSKGAELLRRSRATNIVRGISGGKDLVPLVTEAGDAAQLPVSLTQGSLARKLATRAEEAGAEVGATKAALPGSVPAADIASRLPQVGQSVEGIPVVAARPLRRAVERSRAYWEDIATKPGISGDIPRPVAAALKEEAQAEAARGGVYAKGRLGIPIAPGAQAAAEEATALRSSVLDTAGLSPDDAAKVGAYEKALGESSLATALSEPAQMEHLRRVSGTGGGDWKASLVGRVIAPGVIGGTVGALGGLAASPLGALVGMTAAEFMKSTLWHTLSAATKLKAARALESGGLTAFREVVVPAVIADTERRRSAERALAAQGEGVTAP